MNIYSINDVSLPPEMYEEIFSYMTGPELTKCSLVNKEWHEVARNDRLWLGVVEQYAFGAKKWKQYFGDIGQKTPLPSDILKVLRSSCPFFSGKQVGKTHVLVWLPKTVNSKPYTINSIGEIMKTKYFPETENGYDCIGTSVVTDIEDKSPEGSGWVLMTRDVLEGSRIKSYDQHTALVKGYAEKRQIDYEMPLLLEAITFIIAEYAQSGDKKTYIFGDNPCTYTRCQEKSAGYSWVVGGMSPEGIFVHDDDYEYQVHIGVAALRKFF